MKGLLAVIFVAGSFGNVLAESQAPQTALPTNASLSPVRTIKWVADDVPRYKGFDNVQKAGGFSNVIYLNNCKSTNGCQIRVGNNNSLTNTSSIPQQNSTVTAFAYSDTVWNNVVQCVRAAYASFGVVVTDERPASGNYHMAVVAGSPGNVQMGSGVGGVSPFACGYLPNAISFTFSNIYGPNVDEICNTVAQETAHSWGLDHKFDNRDPMTYLSSGPSRKTFQNQSGPCGEFSARNCQCGGSQMNSFAEIMDTFGSSTPSPPTVKFTAPADNATGLDKEFPIRADITDDIGMSMVELRIDGKLVSTLEKGPWVWNAPKTLGQGNHMIEITAYDVSGTPGKATIHASLGTPCEETSDCESGSTDVCVDGRCVPGGGVQGGLGTTCMGNSECFSDQCASDAEGNSFCVESCDPSLEGCPSGFTCLASGASGICWPGGDEGICNVNGQNNGRIAPTFLLLGLAALLITRRRRR